MLSGLPELSSQLIVTPGCSPIGAQGPGAFSKVCPERGLPCCGPRVRGQPAVVLRGNLWSWALLPGQGSPWGRWWRQLGKLTHFWLPEPRCGRAVGGQCQGGDPRPDFTGGKQTTWVSHGGRFGSQGTGIEGVKGQGGG